MKWIIILLMSFSVVAWEPPTTPEPIIDKKIPEAQQQVRETMTKLDDLGKEKRKVNRAINQADPGTDTKELEALKNQLKIEMIQAQEKARIAKIHLSNLHQQLEDWETAQD